MEHGNIFQSTPPVKAATFAARNLIICGVISIHAAREGGDEYVSDAYKRQGFQSTPPVKAATSVTIPKDERGNISIHAAREGGDLSPLFIFGSSFYFNPRRP